MKNLLKVTTLVVVLLSLSSCSVEPIGNETENQSINLSKTSQNQGLTCSNADPQSRLVNNGTVAFNLSVYDLNMNLLSEDLNVAAGTTTDWSPYTAGDVLFSISAGVTGVADIKIPLTMDNCTELDIIIGSNNTLSSATPQSVD